jgi:hypothetical protein
MRETDRLERELDITVLWGAEKELAALSQFQGAIA